MRTIKFKGKSLDSGEWIGGYYYKECDNTYIIEDRQNYSMLNRNEAVLIDPATVFQFTGFLDKNGKEIYEGDVIHIGPDFCVVIWVEELGGFYLKVDYAKEPCVTPLGAMLRRYDIEVIGNIYEQKWTMRIKVSQRKEEKEVSND
jgi:uncharacterized phage protein (TIGR01671 family)|nr:MAG TPA: YopX protein [Caudoviricetes sp.]